MPPVAEGEVILESRDGVSLVTYQPEMSRKGVKHGDGKYVAKGAEKFIPFYLQGSREPFEDQDDIHFWRLGSSVATVCSVPWLVRHKVSLIIPQC